MRWNPRIPYSHPKRMWRADLGSTLAKGIETKINSSSSTRRRQVKEHGRIGERIQDSACRRLWVWQDDLRVAVCKGQGGEEEDTYVAAACTRSPLGVIKKYIHNACAVVGKRACNLMWCSGNQGGDVSCESAHIGWGGEVDLVRYNITCQGMLLVHYADIVRES